MDLHKVIVSPLVTEKSTNLNTAKKYVVVVHPKATKIEIAHAIERMYSSKVEAVNILYNPAKTRLIGRGRVMHKRSLLKKAIITLKKGEKDLTFTKTKEKK